MTENEAIKELSYENTAYGGRCTEVVRMVAIHALSEIQQYRAIGTVKEIRIKQAEFEVLSKRYLADLKELMEYQKIGTIDELKEDSRFLEFLYNQIPPNEMEQYLSVYRMKDKVAVNGYAEKCGLMPAT